MKKRILTTSLFAFLSLAGYAQKEECQSKASLFVEAAKVKNYNEALSVPCWILSLRMRSP